MRKLLLLMAALYMYSVALAQLQAVSLRSFAGCNGTTLVPGVAWAPDIHTVTFYYEQQVSAVNWVVVTTQPYTFNTNYIIVTPSDISAPTLYRVRAVDEVAHVELISDGVTVNPTSWNADRGNASLIAGAFWGGTCGNPSDFIDLSINFTDHGRPPFTVEYRKTSDINFSPAGTAIEEAIIHNIEPNTNYVLRVTDFCGKVATVTTKLILGMDFTVVQDATTCTNGAIRLNALSDNRSSGIGPYTFSLGKGTPDLPAGDRPPSNYRSSGDFTGLPPGTYYPEMKDACGNYTALPIITLGVGDPTLNVFASVTIPADSCTRTFTPTLGQGTPPVQFGLRYDGDSAFTWQASNVFAGLNRGGFYHAKVRDACGQLSSDYLITISIPSPAVTAVTPLSTSCVTDLVVQAGSNYPPYQYGYRQMNNGSFIYQTSDTLRGLGIGPYEIKVKNRCGNESAVLVYNANSPNCSLRLPAGDYESAGSTQGCQDLSGTDWIDVKDDNNHLIFSLHPHGNLLPQTCWGIRIVNGNGSSLRTTPINQQPTWFLDRNFYIEPQIGTVLSTPVSLRLYLTDTELQNMLTYLGSHGTHITINDLRILKKKGSPGSPVSLEVVDDNTASAGLFTVIQPVIRPYGHDWSMEFAVSDFSEFNPSFSILNPLPLHLLDFSAISTPPHNVLEWKTSDEINTDHFDIERSENGIDFILVAQVRSAKAVDLVHTYWYSDLSPATGKCYYRLKMVDVDGKFSWSRIVSVSGTLIDNDVLIVPNPVTDQLRLSFKASVRPLSLSIFDASGRLVRREEGNNLSTISVGALVKGWYLLEVRTTTGKINSAFLKQ